MLTKVHAVANQIFRFLPYYWLEYCQWNSELEEGISSPDRMTVSPVLCLCSSAAGVPMFRPVSASRPAEPPVTGRSIKDRS